MRVILILIGCLLAAGCSLVEFERSPYAPRGFDVVYSHQEDITFLVWRMGDAVDFDRVDFELFIDGEYQLVDLNDTPFPHEPFGCDRLYHCVQFQIPGEWEISEEVAPLRSIDHRHGIFDSTAARTYNVETTFAIDPVPLRNNSSAHAHLADWFEDHDVPLRRSFEWTLVGYTEEECARSDGQSWSGLQRRVELPLNWTNSTPCFTVRPLRSETEVARPLIPGPMLFAEPIDKQIAAIDHPVMIAFLVDLQVTNLGRCERIADTIEETILSELATRPGSHYHLGVFRPINTDGEEDSGCDQVASSQYPLAAIAAEARQQSAMLNEPATLLLVYLNNVNLAPSERKLEELIVFLDLVEGHEEHPLFAWSIGSNLINGLFPWHLTTPWAPLEDENFIPALESAVSYYLPLRSEDIDRDTPLALPAPNAADSPQHFRICTIFPSIQGIRLPPDPHQTFYFTDTWLWPEEGEPELFFNVEPQRFMPYEDYRQTFISGVYEVCDAFCDHPFVGPNDRRYPSWLGAEGVCQWD